MAYRKSGELGLVFCDLCSASLIEGTEREHEIQNAARHFEPARYISEAACDVCGGVIGLHTIGELDLCSSFRERA